MEAQVKIHIGKVVRNAALFRFGKRHKGIVHTDDLFESVSRFFDLLGARRVDYLLVGGIAMLQYVEGRNTEVIDLIAALSEIERLPGIQIVDRKGNFAHAQIGDLEIDILSTEDPLFARAKADFAATRAFLDREIPCATVEGLLLLKLYALPALYRQGNFPRVSLYENDIASLMHEYEPDLGPLWALLAKHLLESDLASVKEIVEEIRGRIERFRQTGERQ